MSVTWKDVGRSLLGTWPSQVATWGADAIDAYVGELTARRVTPEQALVAIRTYQPEDPSRDFPPSAAKLAQLARRNPGAPTSAEAVQLIRDVLRARTRLTFPEPDRRYWKPGERDEADEKAMLERAAELGVAGFVHSYGLRDLRQLKLDDPEWAEVTRRRLGDEFERWMAANEDREVAITISGRRGEGLGHLDPLSAISGGRPQLEAGQ